MICVCTAENPSPALMMTIPVSCADQSHDDIPVMVVPQSSSLPPMDENVCFILHLLYIYSNIIIIT